jgi:hypothetical protein
MACKLWQWKSELKGASTRLFLAGKRGTGADGVRCRMTSLCEGDDQAHRKKVEERGRCCLNDCCGASTKRNWGNTLYVENWMYFRKKRISTVSEGRFSYNDAYIEVSTTACLSVCLSASVSSGCNDTLHKDAMHKSLLPKLKSSRRARLWLITI